MTENSTGQPTHPLVDLTDADLSALMKRAVMVTAILGGIIALVLGLGLGWGSAGLFAVGAAISALSLLEWARLMKIINARLDQQKASRGTGLVVSLFLVRMILFAGAIYGSLKCFQGSPLLLAAGLALGLVGLVWEALKLLRS